MKSRLNSTHDSNLVEVAIVATELFEAFVDQYGGVKSVAGHEVAVLVEQDAGPIQMCCAYGDYQREYLPREIVDILAVFPTVDGAITVKNFL